MTLVTVILACAGGAPAALVLRALVREVGQSYRTARVYRTIERALAPDAPPQAAAVLAAGCAAVSSPESTPAPPALDCVVRARVRAGPAPSSAAGHAAHAPSGGA